MDILYANGGFYSRKIHGDRVPAGAVKLTQEQYVGLMDGLSAGLVIELVDGSPTLVSPVPTTEQLADTVRAERDRLIESVRWRIERHNDELALGSDPTEPLEPLLQYTQALRDVPQQEGFPESVEWPQCP